MVIRKINHNKIGLGRSIFIFVVLIILILLIVKVFHLIGDEKVHLNQDIPNIPQYQIGEKITSSGTIIFDNNFPLYTHILKVSSGINFGLKSTSINLNDFTGKIDIVGNIDSIIKNLPIIDVKKIKIPKKNLIIYNNTYFLPKELIFFDFSSSQGFYIRKENKKSFIYFNDIKVMEMETFVCNKVTQDNDCEKIMIDLKYKDTDMFTSYHQQDYYKYKSGSWIAFNKDMYGYIFKPLNYETITDISSVIKIYDTVQITKEQNANINQVCKNNNQNIRTMNTIKITQKNNILNYVIDGRTNTDNGYNCLIKFDLRNNWEIIQSSFSIK